MRCLFLCFVCCLLFLNSFAQRSEEQMIYFENIDGFSGYVKIRMKFVGSPTRLHIYNVKLVLTRYSSSRENLEILANAGYDLRGFSSSGVTPDKYAYDIVGQAYIIELIEHPAKSESKLHISNKREDYTTPEFSKRTQEMANNWGKGNSGKDVWETYGGFNNPRVVQLYLSEFKMELEGIIREGKNKAEVKSAHSAKGGIYLTQKKESGAKNEKDDPEDNKGKNKDKKAARKKTLSDYALETQIKGDLALNRGDYKTAAAEYKRAKDMGARIDDKRMEKALLGSTATSMKELFGYIPAEDETVSALTFSYYNKPEYWTNYRLAWTPETHWGDFFIQWGFNINYNTGRLWINQKQKGYMSTMNGIEYNIEQTQNFQEKIKNTLKPDEILFYQDDDGYTNYAIYKYQKFSSIGGGLEFGLGYRIPIASDGGIGLPIGCTGYLNLAKYSANLGYRYFAGIDFSRLFFRMSYLQQKIPEYNLRNELLRDLRGTKNNSFQTLHLLSEKNKHFNALQFAVGVYL